ncbi:MAG: N-acetylmuramoyl-L-alanine amidase [Clostridia bacterium]|nr:N-acetylmuramoyl-L-alanine amidase [Clostridia bacterium]
MAHGNVWLRTEPSTQKGDASKVEILYSKTEIRRIGYSEKWSRVVYKGRVCYVSSSYLVEYAPQNDKTDIYYEGKGKNKDIVIVIDAGHQLFAMNDTEPNGPGSDEMKVKVTSGTVGVATGIWEYQLNLDVALLLRDLLLDEGYSVVMIRETNNVTISNVERAEIANRYRAAAFVRIHANSSANANTKGALTICQTPNNPYNADIYKECRGLSKNVIDEFCRATGFENDGVWENDTMTGINWCRVPTTIVEMGYMSNASEDKAMATEEFRNNAAKGIFAGVVKYVQANHVFG